MQMVLLAFLVWSLALSLRRTCIETHLGEYDIQYLSDTSLMSDIRMMVMMVMVMMMMIMMMMMLDGQIVSGS